MGSSSNKDQNEYFALVPLTAATTGYRFALTNSSAAITVVAGRYSARLTGASSAPGWFEFDGTATLPADVTVGTGFFLDPGQETTIKITSTTLSGILVSGTGTLLLNRLDI